MLTYTHLVIGFLTIISNLIAALWIWLIDRWGYELVGGPLWALRVARGTLLLQLLLGIGLVGGGAVGQTGHYLFAMIAAVAAWFTHTSSQRPGANRLQVLAIGCAVVGLCALGAYLFGRG